MPVPIVAGGVLMLMGAVLGGGGVAAGVAAENATEQPTTQVNNGINPLIVIGGGILAWYVWKRTK